MDRVRHRSGGLHVHRRQGALDTESLGKDKVRIDIVVSLAILMPSKG
jgi:hypothetical protein